MFTRENLKKLAAVTLHEYNQARKIQAVALRLLDAIQGKQINHPTLDAIAASVSTEEVRCYCGNSDRFGDHVRYFSVYARRCNHAQL